MASLIKSGSSASVSATRRGAASGDTSWKATAYLNLYLPGAQGPVQLGGLALAGNNEAHQALVTDLTADSAVLAKVKAKLSVTFQPLKSVLGGYAKVAGYMQAPAADSVMNSAYLNFALPGPDGTPSKLGFVELKKSVLKDAALIDWLTAEAGAIDILLADITLGFQPIKAKASAGYNLD